MIDRLMQLSVVAGGSMFRRKFIAQCKQAAQVNEAFLMAALAQHRDTAFGRDHDFARLTSPQAFKAALPLTTYDDYQPYVERIAQGEANVLTSEPVVHLGLSSGTTGKQKMIPITARSRKDTAMNMVFLTQGMLSAALPASRRPGRGLLLMSAGASGKTASGIPTGPATASGMAAMSRMARWLWTTPPDALLVPSQPDSLHLHLLFALAERNLAYMSATFASSIMDLFHLLERAWPVLVEELSSGKLHAELSIAADVRQRLERALRPRPERAREIRSEIDKGFEGIGPRLWPRLRYINSVTGGSFAIYGHKLRAYLGELPIYSSVYGSTEALIGVGLEPGMATYAMTPGSAYFELIPASEVESPSPATLGLEEVVEGESYELALTNSTGLYRYRLGDMIKVVGRYHRTPVIEFLYRRGQLLNVVGEKTSEQAVLHAAMEAAQRWGLPLIDFTTLADYDASPGRYVFFVEVKAPAALAELSGAPAALEEALSRANPRYQANRAAGKLKPLLLHTVRAGTFAELKALLIRRGASANQVKIPRVVRTEEAIQLLRASSQGARSAPDGSGVVEHPQRAG